MRRNWTLGLMFGLVTLSLATSAFANISGFIGNWKNVDANTRGITRLLIARQGANFSMRAWGKCHPKDCDWGTVRAYAYGPNVSANLNQTAQAVSAVFTPKHAQTLVIVHKAGTNRIRAEVLTRFTDKSKRTNTRNVYTFVRAKRVVATLKEDCLGFNPQTTTVRRINNRWKIVDGRHMMFDFGNNSGEARRSLAIIKHYRMNKSCFVGRPNPSFSYLLVNNNAPQGPMRGEDCTSFNPRTAQVRNVGGQWKIVDGTHQMFAFGNKRNEAHQSLRIIKKYGFTRSCFVGRPGPSFKYLRK